MEFRNESKNFKEALFSNEIEERSYTKAVHALKAWLVIAIRRRRWGFMDWVGVEGICGCGS